MKILNKTKFFIFALGIIILNCILVSYIAEWRDWFWTAVEQKQFGKFIYYLIQFIGLALINCWITGYIQYITNILTLGYRTQLTRKALSLNHYHKFEGGAQRVQDDCNVYPQLFLKLLFEGTKNIIIIVVFSIILISHLSFYYLLFPIIYALIGTFLAGKIAHPLINLNYLNQVFEAKFRSFLTLNSNSIKHSYKEAHRNNFKLYKRTKYLQYFQSFYDQVTIIIPHIILAKLYFSAIITFGVFMQIAAVMVEMIKSMSYLITSFDDLNQLLACRKRLKEMRIL